MRKIIFLILGILLLTTIVSALEPPKKFDNQFNLYGLKNSSYDTFAQIYQVKNSYYIFGERVLQHFNYEIILFYSDKSIKCLKKVKSFSSLMNYCDNSMCGRFEAKVSATKKQLKNSKLMIVPYSDVDCKKNKFINYNPKVYLK